MAPSANSSGRALCLASRHLLWIATPAARHLAETPRVFMGSASARVLRCTPSASTTRRYTMKKLALPTVLSSLFLLLAVPGVANAQGFFPRPFAPPQPHVQVPVVNVPRPPMPTRAVLRDAASSDADAARRGRSATRVRAACTRVRRAATCVRASAARRVRFAAAGVRAAGSCVRAGSCVLPAASRRVLPTARPRRDARAPSLVARREERHHTQFRRPGERRLPGHAFREPARARREQR